MNGSDIIKEKAAGALWNLAQHKKHKEDIIKQGKSFLSFVSKVETNRMKYLKKLIEDDTFTNVGCTY